MEIRFYHILRQNEQIVVASTMLNDESEFQP